MNEQTLSAERIYAETCNSIRTTDEISFKLMGIVPLVTGATLLTFFLKEPIPAENADFVVALALVAALTTLGLFRWELRNIQNCSWLRRRAEALEDAIVTSSGAPQQPKPPHRIGKTEAEKAIYSITILAWLLTPALVRPLVNPSFSLTGYVGLAVLIGVVTILSAFTDVQVAQTAHRSPRT
jgi:hypothetical protein